MHNILIVVSTKMESNNGASNIRPAKMIEAFSDSVHKIEVFKTSRRSNRLNIIIYIIKSIFKNNRFDICYYEPSTYPLRVLEQFFIKWLKFQKTWISYFHRDMYWRYNIGANMQSEKKFTKHKVKQENNLKFLEKNIDLLFVPTELYAIKLNSTLKTVALPPAGNLNKIEYNFVQREGVIYVGGISDIYGVDLLINSFIEINKKQKIPLIIVCREHEFLQFKKLYPFLSNFDWLSIKHLSNNQLYEDYKNARLAVIPKRKTQYNEFSMSFKIFEYVSYGLPVAVSDNFEQVKLVEENSIGINIGSTIESFSKNIVDLYNDFKLLNRYHQNSVIFINDKGSWKHRVRTIIKQYRLLDDK